VRCEGTGKRLAVLADFGEDEGKLYLISQAMPEMTEWHMTTYVDI